MTEILLVGCGKHPEGLAKIQSAPLSEGVQSPTAIQVHNLEGEGLAGHPKFVKCPNFSDRSPFYPVHAG